LEAYKSLNFVNAEMLEGIGPSREQPWMCLKHEITIFIRKNTVYRTNRLRKKASLKILQLFDHCPFTDEIRYLPVEVIVAYSPKIFFQKISQ
jgi:hypothetical protein